MPLLLNGTSDRVDVANESQFDFERTQAFSIAVWAYLDSSVNGHFVGKYVNDAAATGWGFYTTAATSNIGFELINNYGGGNRLDVTSPTSSMPTGAWTHVAVTYDGSSTGAGVKLYKNGVLLTPTINTDALSATVLNNQAVQLGCVGSSNFLAGRLARAVIFNSELTAYQVALLSSQENIPPHQIAGRQPKLHLPLRDINNLKDESGNGNNGTRNGCTDTDGPGGDPSVIPSQIKALQYLRRTGRLPYRQRNPLVQGTVTQVDATVIAVAAAATADVSAPIPVITLLPAASAATAEVTAPVFALTLLPAAAAATASVLASTPTITILPAAAAATAGVSVPTLIKTGNATIVSPASAATANVATPVFTLTLLPSASASTAGGPTPAFALTLTSALASATASIVSPIPAITVTGQAQAIASAVAPPSPMGGGAATARTRTLLGVGS